MLAKTLAAAAVLTAVITLVTALLQSRARRQAAPSPTGSSDDQGGEPDGAASKPQRVKRRHRDQADLYQQVFEASVAVEQILLGMTPKSDLDAELAMLDSQVARLEPVAPPELRAAAAELVRLHRQRYQDRGIPDSEPAGVRMGSASYLAASRQQRELYLKLARRALELDRDG